MEFTSTLAEQRYDAIAASLERTVVGLDFDGVLAPIVADPDEAHIHPHAVEVLRELGSRVLALAVITGRPARQALRLGALEEVADGLIDAEGQLYLYGQYGNERWSSTNRRISSPRPPGGLSGFEQELPRLLRAAGAVGAFVEEKGLAVAVHTRQLDDAAAAHERLVPVLEEAAARHDLGVEPGRSVVEVRAVGMDKGDVVDTLVADLDPGGFVYVGDDLGDLQAFHAVARLREAGRSTLLVFSASDEQSALRPLADVLVEGPDGVMQLLRELADSARPR